MSIASYSVRSRELPGSWRRYLTGLRLPWAHVASSVRSVSLADVLDSKSPALVIAPNTIPEPRQLRDLLADRLAEQQRTTWIWQGIPVATYYPEARALLATRGARVSGVFRDRRFRMRMFVECRCRWTPGTT